MNNTHRNLIALLFTLLLLVTGIEAKNLSILSSSRLDNYELLDVYLEGDLALIPAGLGGLNIVNISDPANPQVLSSYRANGCSWGRLYAWTVGGNYAYGSGRECGIHVLDISNPNQPEFVTNYSDPGYSALRYEHAEVSGSTLFLARHQKGVELVNVSEPQAISQISVIQTENAWATLANDSLLFIADGAAGVKIVSLEDLNNPQVIGTLATSGTAKDLSLTGSYLFVAVGASGVDMIDISDARAPRLVSNYNTTGYASRVASDEFRVAVSDWDDVEVLAYSAAGLELVAYKNTGGRVMALDMADGLIYSAEWEDFTIFEYGVINEADSDLSSQKVEFPRVLSGESDTIIVNLENNGQEILNLSQEQIDNPDFQVEIENYSVAPNSSMEIQVVYGPEAGDWQGDLIIETNDPDEPILKIDLTGNHPYGPMVGDPAPAFELSLVNDVGTIDLEMLEGDPVVIAFFTAW